MNSYCFQNKTLEQKWKLQWNDKYSWKTRENPKFKEQFFKLYVHIKQNQSSFVYFTEWQILMKIRLNLIIYKKKDIERFQLKLTKNVSYFQNLKYKFIIVKDGRIIEILELIF